METKSTQCIAKFCFCVCIFALCIANIAGQESSEKNVVFSGGAAEKDHDIEKYMIAYFARDAQSMWEAAVTIKEKNSTQADGMLNKVCLYAALQQNKKLFRTAVALYPAGKQYEKFIMRGKAPSMLPMIVEVKNVDEVRTLPSGTLAFWGTYVSDCYEKLSTKELDNVIELVNDARENLSAKKMQEAASIIASVQEKENIPEQLTAKAILKESIQYAEITKDNDTIQKCIALAEKKELLTKNEFQELKSLQKSMLATRGISVRCDSDFLIDTETYRKSGNKYKKFTFSDGSVLTYNLTNKKLNFKTDKEVSGKIIKRNGKTYTTILVSDGTVIKVTTD